MDKAAGITGCPSMSTLVTAYTSEEMHSVLPPEITSDQRKGRATELSWRRAADIMRKKFKS
jgi:hypothetical protein